MTASMDLLHSLTNWKLRHGSHEFPGPDGGTCINEAAVVAAGFPYRSISTPDELPACFSRTIGAYALVLNDVMGTRCRQKLLIPFVLRLANTRDTDELERNRERWIVSQTKSVILPMAVGSSFHVDDGQDLTELVGALMGHEVEAHHYLNAHHLHKLFKLCIGKPPASVLQIAGHCALAAANMTARPVAVFAAAVKILDRAILMGNHNPVEPLAASERMNIIRIEARKQKRKAKPAKELATA